MATTPIEPVDSAGEIIAEQQRAQADDASVSYPNQSPSILAPDGRINVDNLETGTDEPVVLLTQSQSTPPAPINNNDEVAPSGTATNPGVGAPRDDNTPPNTTQTAGIISREFSQRVITKPNVLDQYASYTYALSWYLLTPSQYNSMVQTGRKSISNWSLLMQSGGAPTQQSGLALTGRNPYFKFDYYIDNLEIDTLIPLRGTGAALSATDMRFTVTEPNGLTLIENLYKAVSSLYKQANVTNKANYVMAKYVMAIRFYGYDDNGDLVKPGRTGTNGQVNLTDPRAIVEKFYPFVISNLKFRLQNKVVEYTVECKPIPYFANKSQDRGTIPFAFELSGQTVSQLLVGNAVRTQAPAPQNERVDSPQPNTSSPGQPSELTGQEQNTDFNLGIGP